MGLSVGLIHQTFAHVFSLAITPTLRHLSVSTAAPAPGYAAAEGG